VRQTRLIVACCAKPPRPATKTSVPTHWIQPFCYSCASRSGRYSLPLVHEEIYRVGIESVRVGIESVRVGAILHRQADCNCFHGSLPKRKLVTSAARSNTVVTSKKCTHVPSAANWPATVCNWPATVCFEATINQLSEPTNCH
jgi:hypothetical protein